MNKKTILIALAVILLAAGGAYWFYTSPSYSLMRLAKAWDARDLDGVKRFVDIEAIIDNAMDSIANTQIKKKTGKDGDAEENQAMKAAMVKGMSGFFKPIVTEVVNQGMDEFFAPAPSASTEEQTSESTSAHESGEKAGSEVVDSLLAEDQKEDLAALFSSSPSIETDGDKATVRFETTLEKYDLPVSFQFLMKKQGNHWAIVELDEFEETGEQLKAYGEKRDEWLFQEKVRIWKEECAAITQFNEETSVVLEKAVRIEFAKKTVKKGYDTITEMTFEVENTSDKALSSVTFEAPVELVRDKVTVPFGPKTFAVNIAPGKKATVVWSEVDVIAIQEKEIYHNRAVEAQENAVKIAPKVLGIVFDDTTELACKPLPKEPKERFPKVSFSLF